MNKRELAAFRIQLGCADEDDYKAVIPYIIGALLGKLLKLVIIVAIAAAIVRFIMGW